MQIYPAIDLMDGEVVRLTRGKRETKKVYGDPLKVARKFSRYVDKVHIVDLDGAFSGTPVNLGKVKEIAGETDLDIQLGGGIRTVEDLQCVLAAGVRNPIIGTKALDESFLKQAVDESSGLTVSLDISSEGLATDGWKKGGSISHRQGYDLIRRYVKRFVVTVISHDGTLVGARRIERFWEDEEMIYAGGVASVQDVKILEDVGFDGVIIGKALYEGNLAMEDLQKFIQEERC